VPGTVATKEQSAREDHGERDPAVLLASGRFEEAREAARRARRRPPAGRSPAMLALLECEALASLGRDAEALAVATRALTQGAADPDVAARLRVARALALWEHGRTAAAAGEARRALAGSESAPTRARALEALALVALGEDDLDGARERIVEALALSEGAVGE